MSLMSLLLPTVLGLCAGPLAPGDHGRSVMVEGKARPFVIHVPPSYDGEKATPVVMALHPFATNGPMMVPISGLNQTSDRNGFLVVYPNGTGLGPMLHWNVGVRKGADADDLGYLDKVLDEVAKLANVDPKRVYATGYSNGGMMCYRLASERAHRIAAISVVAGTMTNEFHPTRPVSVLHFHGTKDTFVPFDGPKGRTGRFTVMRSVDESTRAAALANGCPKDAVTKELPRTVNDGLVIRRVSHGPGRDGSEVVLYEIVGGGHTWPGRQPMGDFLGKVALDLKANELMWDFFQTHPMP